MHCHKVDCEGVAVNLNIYVDLPRATDTSPSCSNTRVMMHVACHPSTPQSHCPSSIIVHMAVGCVMVVVVVVVRAVVVGVVAW
jgi:hypothetical protein